MFATIHQIAEMATAAGLNVYVSGDATDYEDARIRISAPAAGLHLVITVSWESRNGGENIWSARLIEITSPHNYIFEANRSFDNVSRLGRARHYALLGWVVEQIQYLADAQERLGRPSRSFRVA